MGAEGWGWGWGVPTGRDTEGQGRGRERGRWAQRGGATAGLRDSPSVKSGSGSFRKKDFNRLLMTFRSCHRCGDRRSCSAARHPGKPRHQQDKAPSPGPPALRGTPAKATTAMGTAGELPPPRTQQGKPSTTVRCKDTNVAPSCGQHPLGGPGTTGMGTARRRGRDGDRDQENSPRSTPRARRRGHAALTSSCRLISVAPLLSCSWRLDTTALFPGTR